MNQINLSRVKSIYLLAIVSFVFVLLSLAGILYLSFAGDNVNYFEQSSNSLLYLIWNPQNAQVFFSNLVQNQIALINFSVLLVSYVIMFFGWIFLPTIAAIRASKVVEIKGYSRTAIFATPAVLIWLVLAPIVWLISIIMLISKSSSFIKNGATSFNENAKKQPNMQNKHIEEYPNDSDISNNDRYRHDRYDNRREPYYDQKSYHYDRKREDDRYPRYDDYRENQR